MDDWRLVSDVARRDHYSTEHIRRLIRSGRVRGKKLANLWLISLKSWRQYLAKQQGWKRGPRH